MGRAVIVATKPKRLKSEPKPFRPETSGRGVMASFARNRFLLSRSYSAVAAKSKLAKQSPPFEPAPAAAMVKEGEEVLAPVIGRPLSDILRELNKKVPESLIRTRTEDGFNMRYIPWHFVNRILNLHAPEWSGEVRSIVYSADGKSVSVVYRVTLYGTDAEVHREATGTASTTDTDFGDPLQKAEAMAFRRACARLGLGLYLYHEDML